MSGHDDEYVDGGFASEFDDDDEFDDEPRVPSSTQPAEDLPPVAAASGRHRRRRRAATPDAAVEAAVEAAVADEAAAAASEPSPAEATPSKAKPADRPKAKHPRDDDDFDDDDDDDDFDDEDDDDFDDDDDPASASSSSLGASITAAKPGPSRKLPWVPIAAASVGLVLVLSFAFRDSLFGGSDDGEATDDTEEIAAGGAEAGELAPDPEAQAQPEAQPKAQPEPKPEPKPPAIPTEELDAKIAEATTLVNKQKFDDARVIIDEVLGKIPKEGRALALLAQTHLEKGQLDDALGGANDCVDADPDQAFCWIIIATVEQNNDNLPRALEAYRKYLEVEPDGRHAKSAKKQVSRLESKVEG